MNIRFSIVVVGLAALVGPRAASAQAAPPQQPPTVAAAPGPAAARQSPGETPPAPSSAPVASLPPAGYVIGPDDVLQIVFWRDKDMSGEVVVRPDGRISLPLINEVVAAGRTPDELRADLVKSASQFLGNPSATVVVKEIRSRKVFITGSVEKPGPYVLTAPTTVVQLIAMAGGLKEYADQRNIVVMRTANGQQTSYAVDYRSILRRQNLEQNMTLLPGDTVLVR